jgi:hypothetical protein
MKIIRKIALISVLSIGMAHAETVPCNGFKLEFKNTSNQDLVVDAVNLVGANVITQDSDILEVNNRLLFTVSQRRNGQTIWAEFLFHTKSEPYKELKLNFNLNNKNVACEIDNTSKQGTLDVSIHRVLGGIYLPIKS